VARRWIANDVCATQREVRTRPIRDPGVLANLEANAHVADVEHEVADRVTPDTAVRVGALEDIDLAGGPCFEPTRLVMDAIARKELFRNKPDDLAVGEESGGVVQGLLVIDGQTDGDNHAFR
jgi:hypothetical protein